MSTAETLARRALGTYLRVGFLGPALDDTTYCPVAIPHLSFDPEMASDVAPFTVAQVRDQVGYVTLTLSEIDSWQAPTTSGVVVIGGVPTQTSSWYTLTRCRFAIRVPGTADTSLVETYQDKILALFLGVTIHDSGPPDVMLRQLAQYPPRVWGDSTESTWRKRVVDVPIRRRERRAHAGAQEVA